MQELDVGMVVTGRVQQEMLQRALVKLLTGMIAAAVGAGWAGGLAVLNQTSDGRKR